MENQNSNIQTNPKEMLKVLGLTILSLALVFASYFWLKNDLGEIFSKNYSERVFQDLSIITSLIFAYASISMSIMGFVAAIKGGRKNLRTYKEKGLISGLIWGLISGLILGLIEEFSKEEEIFE